jgi:hypothetical protein
LLRYDWDHIFEVASSQDRDTKDQRIQSRLDHTMRGHDLAYSFTWRQADNIVSGVTGTENSHLFHWGVPVYRPHRKLTLTSSYRFTHRAQVQEQVDGGRILTLIPGAAGMYAEDSSPEFGQLEVLASLTDLNTGEPTEPPIDIGGALTHRNLGLDFGFERTVTVMYVYTDRLSASGLRWDVYVSRDNLEWELWERNPAVVFNQESGRYEIVFATVSTRYVKVVNSGVNAEPEVFVTELEGPVESEEEGKVTRKGSGHLVDLGADYDISESISSSLDVSYQSEPFTGVGGRKERGDYTVGAEYRQTRAVLHHARWAQGFDQFANAIRENTSSASYTLLVEPIETIRFTTSVDGRLDHRDGEKIDEFKGVLFRVFGTPVQAANVSADVSRSRNEQHDVDRIRDQWNFRVSADGSVTRSLTAILDYSYQRITSRPEDRLRIRNQYSISFDYRVTRTIFARGSYSLTREQGDDVLQDYLVSWNVTPKLTVGGQAFFIHSRLGTKTERYNANLTYNLTARSTLYSSYSNLDFTEVGGPETVSFSMGLRAAI